MSVDAASKLIPSYGRRRGRKLRATKQQLIDELLPSIALSLEEGERLIPSKLFKVAPGRLNVEIGFGGGEHLAAQAARHPQDGFIGCEPFVNGVASLLRHVDTQRLSNVRIFQGDGRLLLAALPGGSVQRLYILFPDPWPKARHHKRRIVNQEILGLIERVLAPAGLLRLATDHAEYAAWMLEQLMQRPLLRRQAESAPDWNIPPADWVTTRYQQKAARQGRGAMFLDFIRT